MKTLHVIPIYKKTKQETSKENHKLFFFETQVFSLPKTLPNNVITRTESGFYYIFTSQPNVTTISVCTLQGSIIAHTHKN